MTVSAELSASPDSEGALRPLSQVLDELRRTMPRQNLTVGTLVEALHERGIGALMILFALVVMIPIPGLNTVFAMPLALLTARQALGRHTVWLPERMMRKPVDAERMARQIGTVLPWLVRLEKLLRPRLAWVTTGGTARAFGAIGLFMSLFASIPVPLTHTVPGAGLLLMAGGLTQRDGLAVAAGAVIGMSYIILLTGAIVILGPHAVDIIHQKAMIK